MKINCCRIHGNPRFRVNIQKNGFRKRLFFRSLHDACRFTTATQTPITIAHRAILKET